MSDAFVVGIQKTRQSTGWEHGRIWQRTVNSENYVVILCRARMVEYVHSELDYYDNFFLVLP